eukprot:Sspe_Gene.4247::Locus_1400_Transcript_1_1_Confidence_1.000_Length_2000::g.4247::m.4247
MGEAGKVLMACVPFWMVYGVWVGVCVVSVALGVFYLQEFSCELVSIAPRPKEGTTITISIPPRCNDLEDSVGGVVFLFILSLFLSVLTAVGVRILMTIRVRELTTIIASSETPAKMREDILKSRGIFSEITHLQQAVLLVLEGLEKAKEEALQLPDTAPYGNESPWGSPSLASPTPLQPLPTSHEEDNLSFTTANSHLQQAQQPQQAQQHLQLQLPPTPPSEPNQEEERRHCSIM